MKFKPKEVLVNLPVVLTFQSEDEVVQMAAAFNTFVHGKVKMKYEILGLLGGQTVGLFYIQRNNESQQIRDEFMKLILEEESAPVIVFDKEKDPHMREEDKYAHALCSYCDENSMLHLKGEDHCRCGRPWAKGKCEFFTASNQEETYRQKQKPKQWHNDDRCLGVAGCMCVDCDPYGGMKP